MSKDKTKKQPIRPPTGNPPGNSHQRKDTIKHNAAPSGATKKQDPQSTESRQSTESNTMGKRLFRFLVGTVALSVAGMGANVLSYSPPVPYDFARICFAGSAFLLLAGISYELVNSKLTRPWRMTIAFLAFGFVGVAVVEAWQSVNSRQTVAEQTVQQKAKLEQTDHSDSARSGLDHVTITGQPGKNQTGIELNNSSGILVNEPDIKGVDHGIVTNSSKNIGINKAKIDGSPKESAATRLPRLGSGPDAYKDIDDLQIAKWANEEADKIEDLASHWNDGMPGASVNARIWRFSEKFKDCCAQEVKDLRDEIMRRLGPPAKDADEVSAWTSMFPQEKYSNFGPRDINPMSVKSYAPYLRLLGLRLKRRATRRFSPKSMSFTEAQAQPEGKFTYRIIVNIETKEAINEGYIVVEFDKPIAMVGADFPGVNLLDFQFIDNRAFVNYLRGLSTGGMHFYVLGIGKTPFTHSTPIHILAAGSADVPFHVSKVTLFDE